MTNRWGGARFVALFAGAHAPNDLVEADRVRGLNSFSVGEERLFSGALGAWAGWAPSDPSGHLPLKGEDIVVLGVLPPQGEVPAEQAEGAPG